ncbi:uncharacterized protein UV8b_01835 [Ustilaginoidea virens]|uniref:Uncharacterized protein n=1 Tax=Ustilaginoidea virens TaxID=1159556 RepID=A0A1B5L5C6_USTVR|nr:uncharacterized protein UV8b_01835 [Ustilaginoidea virens]QUC17594.1 hypothetical protein UV8b_01835 [Ustilaginoidea virens]GAO18669.1 hypothetical protein UVI_02059090 [Ustilaginoidea virens]
MDWAKTQYRKQRDSWVPWIEDMYLYYFTSDNKASYTTKENLDRTKVTGDEDVDHIQEGVNQGVAGQLGQGGVAQPAGDVVSKEGINRAERKGADQQGEYLPNPLPGL